MSPQYLASRLARKCTISRLDPQFQLLFGHRNIESAAIHPQPGALWIAEMGPIGGDNSVGRLTRGARLRVWDISPGYLNRQSLLGEHRELHGLYSILFHGKKGYSRHPETLRWVDRTSGLTRRHALLVAEMRLRGYSHQSPIPDTCHAIQWPEVFVTPPSLQYALLKSKYQNRSEGRIPFPRGAQELWAQHKYSVMARDPATYRAIGRYTTRMRCGDDCSALAEDLVLILRETPQQGRLTSALEHMWGHVSGEATVDDRKAAMTSPAGMLCKMTELATRLPEPYLMASTALSDLAAFIDAA